MERMLDQGPAVELLVGCRRDPAFGSVVAVGAGGTLTELAADTAVALGPVDRGACPCAASPPALCAAARRLPRLPAACRR